VTRTFRFFLITLSILLATLSVPLESSEQVPLSETVVAITTSSQNSKAFEEKKQEVPKAQEPLKSRQKKILILIIASDNHPAFLQLQEVWRSYMHLDPEHVEAYFIKGNPNMEAPYEIIGDTLYSKVVDDYQPGILKKTVLSMEFVLDKIHNFDYVLRTNLSSFYAFPQLLQFLNTLPEKNCYCALPRLPCANLPAEFGKTPFGWGGWFHTLSRSCRNDG